MATNAEIAARLLRHAAEFFNSVGEQNPGLQEQLGEEARIFAAVADVVEQDPTGSSFGASGGGEADEA
ncbi:MULTISPECIES: hypothetical protein [Limibacillus]|jgi:hypothetical protein|uniref:Uncharacterized protein n=1 Tax=Limibacillus halophilus TaxID=1579333 RepID=A0A839SSI8_9PROT|nr:hypothetical protein [Limibacillus halophilus]MBB3064949.1 hypothetical protein [Limibacillus halophilus]